MRTHWSTLAALILGFSIHLHLYLSNPSLKPGNCPSDSIVTMQLSPRPPCKFDGDCPVDEKCCFLNDLFTCVSPYHSQGHFNMWPPGAWDGTANPFPEFLNLSRNSLRLSILISPHREPDVVFHQLT
uniref:WAP domain-containing protein n=1 Tax=Nothobranchius furzeri TaxID=105023 RepID=A0A8C6NUC7_NOTFU